MGKIWEVKIDDEVMEIRRGMSPQDSKKLAEAISDLRKHGPHLERETGGKQAHSLKNAKYANLKELIVKSGRSAWRFAYYIDKNGIVHILCGGDKRGVSKSVFYNRLIKRAIRKIDAINK